MSKETFYFSHDCHARADRKLVNLQMKHGMEGIGIYWCVIEMLYEEGGKLKNDLDLLSFALRCDKEKIKSVICDFELFISDDLYFWSESVLDRINKRVEKSNATRASVSHKWGTDLISQNKINRSQRLTAARLLGTHTKKDWEEMQVFFHNKCVKCDSDIYIVKDHIIPLYQGGSEALSNIQPLCHKCNAAKGSESVDYRKHFCELNAYEMPTKYLEMPTIKKRKEKNNIYTDDFLSFYNTYPRHVAKQAAWKAFVNLKDDFPGLQTILSKIEEFKKSDNWTKDNGKFIPHPATWLNDRRWEDEMQGAKSSW